MTWTMLDTFSGIGGFSLAAEWTGRIRPVQFVEIDPWCRRVLAKHWPGVPIHDDIRTFLADTDGIGASGRDETAEGQQSRGGWATRHWFESPHRERLDLLTGGFPCQPFSAAGKQGGAADDRYLWPELARVIRSTRPRYCLLENVPGIIGLAGGLDRVLADLGESGYATGTVVIPAAAVGAYHRRDRVWIVAHTESGRDERPSEQAGVLLRPEFSGEGRAGADVAHASDGGLRRGSASGATGLAAQRGQNAADANSTARQARHADRMGEGEPPERLACGCDAADATHGRSQTALLAEGDGPTHALTGGGCGERASNGHEALSSLGLAPDGLPGRLAQARRKTPVRAPRAVQQQRYQEVFRRTLLQNARGDGIGEQLESLFPLAAPIAFGPDWEAGVPRVTQHEADRVNKLKALGNAIVPQVAYELLMMMLAVDDHV